MSMISGIQGQLLEVTDGGKNPTFQEKFVFTLIEGLPEINVVVWNSNTLTYDDFIGSGKIQLQKVLSMGYDDTAWPIQTKTGRHAGEVRLIMFYANANKPATSYAPSYTAPQPHTPMYSAPSYAAPAAAYQTPSAYPAYPPHSAAYPPTPYPPPQTTAYPPVYPPPSAYPPMSYPPHSAYPHVSYPPPTQDYSYPPGPYPGTYPPRPY
ncbi:hypothetical protein R3W88_003671 [Solanum pinnatisectum]|uniref:C2 domain-containing protein n=1 Tax=Solanum pinnatisectum TaxID=50273 RepID=A0AAV9MPR8_9SOLN|nr:hypothetical protein R3W88_003671 [Solanum pinnatisectum]